MELQLNERSQVLEKRLNPVMTPMLVHKLAEFIGSASLIMASTYRLSQSLDR